MASVSLDSDPCTYEEKLARSVYPGMYWLNTPAADCGACGQDIPADPSLRYQTWGQGHCPQGSVVDDGSELLGLNYKATKCARDHYLPGRYEQKGTCQPKGTQPARACEPPQESTRLSNPPCNLHGTGWNRWEWLCWNPQDRAIIPFVYNTNATMVAKDNFRPCLPHPLDQTAAWPTGKNDTSMLDGTKGWSSCAVKADDFSSGPGYLGGLPTRSCATVAQM